LHVVPSIAKIKEIAGEDAVEVTEEYQDVYMYASIFFRFGVNLLEDVIFGGDWQDQVPAR
jgi:hypothetical protein